MLGAAVDEKLEHLIQSHHRANVKNSQQLLQVTDTGSTDASPGCPLFRCSALSTRREKETGLTLLPAVGNVFFFPPFLSSLAARIRPVTGRRQRGGVARRGRGVTTVFLLSLSVNDKMIYRLLA